MSRRTFFTGILFFFFVSIAIHVFLLFDGFYGISADESGRIHDTIQWLSTGKSMSDVWLPGYRIVLGFALKVYYNLFVTPRILSFIFSILTFFGTVWFAHELFKDRRTTLITAALISVFPQKVILGVVPLTEILFISLIVFACVFTVSWISKESFSSLIFASIFFAAASTFRYEGWIFSAIFFLLIVLFYYKNFSASRWGIIVLLIVGCIIASFPVYWMIDNMHNYHNPFYFTRSEKSLQSSDRQSFLSFIKNNPLCRFVFHNAITFNIIGLFTFFPYFVRSKESMIKSLLSISLLLFSVIPSSSTIPSHNPWRAATVWSIALIPWTALWLSHFIGHLHTETWWKKYSLPSIFMLSFFCQTAILTRTPIFSKEELNVAQTLQKMFETKTIHENENVLIETSQWNYIHIVYASQFPQRFVLNTGYHPHHPTQGILSPGNPFTLDSCRSHNITFIVVESDIYKYILAQCPFISQVKDFGHWTLYKVIKDRSLSCSVIFQEPFFRIESLKIN